MTAAKPVLFIVDSAIDITGALVSAARQSELSNDVVDTILVLPVDHAKPSSVSANFSKTIHLPIISLRKSVRSVLLYLPMLVVSAIQLNSAMKLNNCTRLQLNDFNLMHGVIVRLLGFRGRIVTWIRIDPKRYGVIGRTWLALSRWASDELVVVSKFIARQMPAGYRSTVIYNAVPSIIDGPRGDSRQLLFIGNYMEGKGQDDAIRAFQRVASHFPDAELLFHGSDMGLAKNRDYRIGLERLANGGEGKERIHIRDFVDDPQSLYRQAFAAVNFSHSESFSLTCLEASAHGLAVIATRCGGPEEIVEDRVTGLLVPIGDVEAMAAGMTDLLSDPARAVAMGEAGRRLVNARFGSEQFTRTLVEVFDLN